MTAIYTAAQAYEIAIANTDIANNHPTLASMTLEDGFYHMIIRASLLEYEIYVDALSGEVMGISTQPFTDFEVDMDKGVIYHMVVNNTGSKVGYNALNAIRSLLRGNNRRYGVA